jgi:NAD(P)-dependent dehydrogenase (short-subunit alcohol dehydrogenase family)
METRTLEGKTALVTGASKGIGKACAGALALDGATVVIMGRGEEPLAQARNEIAQAAPAARVEMFVGDACDEDKINAALAFTHGLGGRLDILASTVGNPTFKPLLMRELADVREEFELNFMSAFLAVRHGVPLMERGGSIICVSSDGNTQSTWGLSIYGSAKAALERFVRAAAFELGSAGIRINAVRPGLTLPPEAVGNTALAPMARHYIGETPLGRVGHPDDIARVVRFLAGPDSGWVTGQTIGADGGMDQGKGPNFMNEFYGKEVMDQIRAGKPAKP